MTEEYNSFRRGVLKFADYERKCSKNAEPNSPAFALLNREQKTEKLAK
jgi:hypothetical protein